MSISIAFKEEVHQHFRQLLAGKLAILRASLQDLSESAADETKSSAGDKYETSKAMLHMEQDNIRQQLTEMLSQQALLESVNHDRHPGHIIEGSLIKIGEEYYYLSAALGKAVIEGIRVFALSARSPLGSQLLHKAVGETVVVNGVTRTVEDFV